MTNAVWDWSSTPASNNATPPYGWPAGMNGSQVEPTGRQMMATISEAIHSLVAGGTADVITGTLANVPTALTDGMQVLVRAASANATTTPTFNLNSLGAFTITKLGGTALAVADIAGNLHELILRYNSAHTRWELLNPAISISDATNGGINVATGNVLSLKPSDLLTKSSPGASDSFMIMDAAASNVAKTSTLVQAIGAFMAPIKNSLGANVAINNGSSFFDGPSIAQGSTGTWYASGTVTVSDASGAQTYNAILWDGTTVIDSTVTHSIAANVPTTISLSGYLASPAGNLRISVEAPSTTTSFILANNSGQGHDSTISAFRIG